MMSENKLDFIIREACKASPHKPAEATSQCLSDEDMAHYITSVLAEDDVEEGLRFHITECDLCFSKAASCISALKGFDRDAPVREGSTSIKKAKSIPRRYPRRKNSPVKRHRYLFVAGIFFILSFVVKAYFLQFLAGACVFGFKWVMDTGGSKALIMIYDAWQHKRGLGDEKEKRDSLINRPRF